MSNAIAAKIASISWRKLSVEIEGMTCAPRRACRKAFKALPDVTSTSVK